MHVVRVGVRAAVDVEQGIRALPQSRECVSFACCGDSLSPQLLMADVIVYGLLSVFLYNSWGRVFDINLVRCVSAAARAR
jgi:hypothetical protein